MEECIQSEHSERGGGGGNIPSDVRASCRIDLMRPRLCQRCSSFIPQYAVVQLRF